MTTLAPLETLYEANRGIEIALPPELERLYGRLEINLSIDRPAVLGNFVTTLDGVVSLNARSPASTREIRGDCPHDPMVMGILRAISDVVIVGSGSLRASPNHIWTPERIYRPLSDAYGKLRTSLGKSRPPLNVIVTARGELDPELPVFHSGEVPALIVTTPRGLDRLCERGMPTSVRIVAVRGVLTISAQSILEAVIDTWGGNVVLVEGGPQLIGGFFQERCLDDLFLTLAPQIAGRDGTAERPGLVSGISFAPERPLWGTLAGIKRAGNHLLLRYAFERG